MLTLFPSFPVEEGGAALSRCLDWLLGSTECHHGKDNWYINNNGNVELHLKGRWGSLYQNNLYNKFIITILIGSGLR